MERNNVVSLKLRIPVSCKYATFCCKYVSNTLRSFVSLSKVKEARFSIFILTNAQSRFVSKNDVVYKVPILTSTRLEGGAGKAVSTVV